MIEHWENDRQYLECKFNDPDFYNGTPGTPLPELQKRLAVLAEKDRELPHRIAKANGFELMLQEIQIAVSNNDYFPGLALTGKRPLRPVYMSAWQTEVDNTVFSADELADQNDCWNVRLANLIYDYEHSVPDWDAVLELGFSGLLQRIIDFREKRKKAGTMTAEAETFFDSLEKAYRAVLILFDRLIAEAVKLPAFPKGGLLVEALRRLRNGKAETFYEALLQIWFYFLLSEYGDAIQTRSFGNLDRVLYPYYRRDLESGRFTDAEIRYFVRSFLYQATAMHYRVGHPFYFGGTNEDGSSAINELSFLILDEYDRMKIFDPKLHIKVSPQTPTAFIDKALDMIRRGSNSIAFVGEPCIIRTMLKHGYSRRQAETADIKGCYEYCVRGGAVETAPVTVNSTKILGLTLRNGTEPVSGRLLGLKTGEAESFTTFGKLYKAFLRQIFFRYERYMNYADRMERHLEQCNPALMLSGTFESSLERAVDGYARGAKYNNSNIWICGTATTGDSLTMIKKYVYDRKLFSLRELVDMLDKNFEGHENIRLLLLNDREKYGNNLDLPDRITRHVAEAIARRFNRRPNGRGGFYTTSLHASNRFIEWAPMVEATPDGRKQGDELSKNMTATQGNSFCGATALTASVLKFDSSMFMADLPVDIMLHPSEVRGEAGLRAMRALLMTYVKHYGHAMHFNVMDPEILRKAQQEPEQYRHLQVRICGWNVLWNSIPREEQDAYIRQAEKL